jgi:hypothetical protein
MCKLITGFILLIFAIIIFYCGDTSVWSQKDLSLISIAICLTGIVLMAFGVDDLIKE